MKRAAPLPFVFANFAMTADGKIAFANHRFAPFASARDRAHMMELRATADAVLSGARTVDLQPATLGPGGSKYRKLRLKRGLDEYNLRVIVSGSGSVDPQAEIFKHKFSPIIILTTRRGAARLKKLGVQAEIKNLRRHGNQFSRRVPMVAQGMEGQAPALRRWRRGERRCRPRRSFG